jgi:uncharacterized membrane protein HdeD (DUF308 family)
MESTVIGRRPAFERSWGSLVFRGILAILFGVLAFARPGVSLAVLLAFFGAFVLLEGILAIVGAVRAARANVGQWWALLLEGIFGIAIAVITFIAPAATAIGLLYYAAAWALITGVMEIAAGFHLSKHVKGSWTLALAGVASVIFGILLMVYPGAGILTMVWIFGAYAIVLGVLLVSAGFKLRQIEHHPTVPLTPRLA